MPAHTQVVAGRCTTTFAGTREAEQHGDVIVIVKPDNTVLVHDADGYQPVAWLTRPESVTVTEEAVTASDGDQLLHVEIHEAGTHTQLPIGEAGTPVGTCPDCASTLVRTNGAVSCPSCGSFGIPSSAMVCETTCDDCGFPQIRVERGESFTLCLDRDCESLDERVRDRFDRRWSCPSCGDDLRVLRRGGLMLGCDSYPDCETGFAFPDGVHSGQCGCGLPKFETATGLRCVDATCDHPSEVPT